MQVKDAICKNLFYNTLYKLNLTYKRRFFAAGTYMLDKEIKQLEEAGTIPPISKNAQLRMNKDHWRKVLDNCEDDHVDLILSYPQAGFFNGWLYAVCEERRGLEPNR